MIIARLAVYASILCTLWFNGSYAWSKGGTEIQQYGMVAVAITIDLCKCGFLPAASHLWRNAWRVPAIVLVLLWPLAFAYSVFSGFASITTNRSATSAVAEGQVQQRSRNQVAYDQATAALDLAKASQLWTTTTACTSIKTTKHTEFCKGLEALTNQQQTAAAVLNTTMPAHADPEITVLRDNTGLSMPSLQLLISAVPALILELVSSLGLYAISYRSTRKPTKRLFRQWLGTWRDAGKNDAMNVLEASAVPSPLRSTIASPSPATPIITWKIPANP